LRLIHNVYVYVIFSVSESPNVKKADTVHYLTSLIVGLLRKV